MKVTLSAAMRARDVSRPSDQDLAAAAEVESTIAERVPREAAPPKAAATPPGEQRTPAERSPRQRQRRRHPHRLGAGERRQYP